MEGSKTTLRSLNDAKTYIPKITLPIAKGYSLSKRLSSTTYEEKKEMKQFPYRNILGYLSFLAGRMPPDLTYAVNSLSRF